MSKHNHLFDWLELADYAEANSFNLFDWAVMLSHRGLWRKSLPYNQPMSDLESKWAYFRDYLDDVLPCNIHENRSVPKALEPWDREVMIWSTRIVDDITAEFSKDPDNTLRRLKFEVDVHGTRLLAVNPWTPDNLLGERFQHWWRKQRKESPLPAKRRGRPSSNVEITADHLRSWLDYNVLAVFDLDFYAQVFGIKPLSDEQLVELLECHLNVKAKNWGRRARAKTKKAMQCLDVLVAQAQATCDGDAK